MYKHNTHTSECLMTPNQRKMCNVHTTVFIYQSIKCNQAMGKYVYLILKHQHLLIYTLMSINNVTVNNFIHFIPLLKQLRKKNFTAEKI